MSKTERDKAGLAGGHARQPRRWVEPGPQQSGRREKTAHERVGGVVAEEREQQRPGEQAALSEHATEGMLRCKRSCQAWRDACECHEGGPCAAARVVAVLQVIDAARGGAIIHRTKWTGHPARGTQSLAA